MTVYSVDDFNRANNAAIGNSSSGHAWTEQMSAHFSIASNQLSATGTGGSPRGGKHATIDHGTADGTYKVKLASLSNGCYGGIVLRWIDSDNFVRAWVYHQGLSPFQYHLYVDQYVGGVYTVLSGPTVLTFVAGAPLRAELAGSQLLVVYNDTTRVTATLANTTGTKHGVYADSDVSGTSVLDDWEGGPAWTGDQLGVAVLDRFGRADSASAIGTAETGQSWANSNGTWGISGGRAYTPSGVSSGIWGGLATIDAGSAVMTVSAILDANPASFTDYGITARYVDGSNNWVAFLNRDSGGVLAVYAGKAVAGVVTYSIASGIPFPTMGPNANLKRYPCSLVLAVDSSNTWRLYVNGYRIGNTPTDSAHSAATKAGLTAYNTTATKLDEFIVRTPSGAYVPPQTVSGLRSYPRLVKGLAPDAYWPMDDDTAATLVVDRSGGLADMLVTGVPALQSPDVLVGGVAQPFVDHFERANAASLGAPWNSDAGAGSTTYTNGHDAVGVTGNRAYPTAASGTLRLDLAVLDYGTPDVDMSVTLGTADSNGGTNHGLVFRFVDANNYWRVLFDNTPAADVVIQKVVGGTFTSVGTFAHTSAAGDVLRVVGRGGSIKWYLNGALLGSYTDFALSTATKHGIYFAIGATYSAAARLDNFSIGPAPGASVAGWLNTNTVGHPVTPALAPGSGDFTLMFWSSFDPTKVAAKDWVMIPFCIDTWSFSGSGIQGDGLVVYLAVAGTALGAGVVMRVYLNSSFVDFTGLPEIIDDKSHLVIVERAAGVLTGYVDGKASANTGSLGGPVPAAQDRFFAIGGDPSGNTAGNNYYSQGRQAHTAFWKRALTAAERALLLQGGREMGVSV